MENNSVAERLRVIRADQKLKQKEMADFLKISYPSLVAYENDKTEPSFRLLRHLLNLEYNLNWVVGDIGPMKIDGVPRLSSVDAHTLEKLMTASKEIISKQKLSISDGKLAKVLVMAYQEDCQTGKVDEKKLLSLLQLAAE